MAEMRAWGGLKTCISVISRGKKKKKNPKLQQSHVRDVSSWLRGSQKEERADLISACVSEPVPPASLQEKRKIRTEHHPH